MALKQAFTQVSKKIGIAATGLSLAFLAGCGPSPQQLGDGAKDHSLVGTTSIIQVYTDAAPQSVLTIDGNALKPNSRYISNGPLVIRGDVPPKTEIEVSNGKLEVTGNVASDVTLDVRLPVITHQQTDITLMPMFLSCGNNCTTMMMIPTPVTTTIEDGLAHPSDTGPAVKIGGTIGSRVRVTTNGGIQAGSWGADFRAKTGYGRAVQQLSPSRQRVAVPSV